MQSSDLGLGYNCVYISGTTSSYLLSLPVPQPSHQCAQLQTTVSTYDDGLKNTKNEIDRLNEISPGLWAGINSINKWVGEPPQSPGL